MPNRMLQPISIELEDGVADYMGDGVWVLTQRNNEPEDLSPRRSTRRPAPLYERAVIQEADMRAMLAVTAA